MSSRLNEMDRLVMKRIETEVGKNRYEWAEMNGGKYRSLDTIPFHPYRFESTNFNKPFEGKLTMIDLRAAQQKFKLDTNLSPSIAGLRFFAAKFAVEQEDALKMKTVLFDYNSIRHNYEVAETVKELLKNKTLGNLFEKDMWLFPMADENGPGSHLLAVLNPSGVLLKHHRGSSVRDADWEIYSIGPGKIKKNGRRGAVNWLHDNIFDFMKTYANGLKMSTIYDGVPDDEIPSIPHYRMKSYCHSSIYILSIIRQIMKTKNTLPNIRQMFLEADRPRGRDPREFQKEQAVLLRVELLDELQKIAHSNSDPVIQYVMELRERIFESGAKVPNDELIGPPARRPRAGLPLILGSVITLDDEED